MEKSDIGATGAVSGWRRWLAKLAAFDEALCLSANEIQERRIARLEAEIANLKTVVANLAHAQALAKTEASS